VSALHYNGHMKIPAFVVDAFTQQRLSGNPAGVCVLEHAVEPAAMQAIATELGLPATAFIVARAGGYDIRWFTPIKEIELCGHATLAAGHVVLRVLEPTRDAVQFSSGAGPLSVARAGDKLRVALPRLDAAPRARLPELATALGAEPRALFARRGKLIAVFARAQEVAQLAPDFARVARLDGTPAVIATAPGDGFACDFVSRYFAPAAGLDEDAVTGSAHCTLVPYWAGELGRALLFARQISKRGGEIWCELRDDEVRLDAYVTPFLVGEVSA
jgi:PhzF family phenazine biosynthesis protein